MTILGVNCRPLHLRGPPGRRTRGHTDPKSGLDTLLFLGRKVRVGEGRVIRSKTLFYLLSDLYFRPSFCFGGFWPRDLILRSFYATKPFSYYIQESPARYLYTEFPLSIFMSTRSVNPVCELCVREERDGNRREPLARRGWPEVRVLGKPGRRSQRSLRSVQTDGDRTTVPESSVSTTDLSPILLTGLPPRLLQGNGGRGVTRGLKKPDPKDHYFDYEMKRYNIQWTHVNENSGLPRPDSHPRI